MHRHCRVEESYLEKHKTLDARHGSIEESFRTFQSLSCVHFTSPGDRLLPLIKRTERNVANRAVDRVPTYRVWLQLFDPV